MDTKSYVRNHGIVATLSLLILIILTGCSNKELSREEATSLIAEGSNYPVEITAAVKINFYLGHRGEENRKIAYDLEREGYIKNVREYGGDLIGSFTEKAKPYIRGEVETRTAYSPGSDYDVADILAYTVDFEEVTGITYEREDKSLAKVEYSVLYTGSPLIKLPLRRDTPKFDESLSGKTVTKFANLQLYDDGWRLAQARDLR